MIMSISRKSKSGEDGTLQALIVTGVDRGRDVLVDGRRVEAPWHIIHHARIPVSVFVFATAVVVVVYVDVDVVDTVAGEGVNKGLSTQLHTREHIRVFA